MLLVASCLAIGILIGDLLQIKLIILLVIILTITSTLLATSINLISWKYRGTLVYLNLIIVGMFIIKTHTVKLEKSKLPRVIINQNQLYHGQISKISQSKKYLNLLVSQQIISNNPGSSDKISSHKTLLKIKLDQTRPSYQIGDKIQYYASLEEVTKNTSPYLKSLYNQSVQYVSYIKEAPKQLDKYNKSLLTYIRYQVRPWAISSVDRYIKSQEAKDIVKALVLGDKSFLDSEIKSTFSSTGTMHILAVSGLHVGIVALLLFHFFERILPYTSKYHWLKIALVLIGLVLFAELSGGASPIWRAVLMTSIYLTGRAFSYKSSALNSLGVAAFVMLIYNPLSIYSLSFQLSFIALLGIILIYPLLEKVYLPTYKYEKPVIAIIYMGIAAQISIAPISIYHFEQFSLFSPFSSIIAIPCAYVILAMTFLMLLASSLIPAIAFIFANFIDFVADKFYNILELIAYYKIGYIDHLYISRVEAILLSCFILLLIIFIYSDKRALLYGAMLMLISQAWIRTHSAVKAINHLDIVSKEGELIEEIHIGSTCFSLLDSRDNIPWSVIQKRRDNRITQIIDFNL